MPFGQRIPQFHEVGHLGRVAVDQLLEYRGFVAHLSGRKNGTPRAGFRVRWPIWSQRESPRGGKSVYRGLWKKPPVFGFTVIA